MMLALLFAAGGLTILGLIIGARWLDALTWRRRLVAYELRLPSGLTAGQVSEWLSSVAADSQHWPIGIEIEATRGGIAFYLLMSRSHETSTLARLRSALPGVRADLSPDYLAAGRPDPSADDRPPAPAQRTDARFDRAGRAKPSALRRSSGRRGGRAPLPHRNSGGRQDRPDAARGYVMTARRGWLAGAARAVGIAVGLAPHLNSHPSLSDPRFRSPAPAKHLVPTGDEV
jgi:hypothetical protein